MFKLGKILIIDGSYLMHRSLHVDSIFDLKNSDGIGTGGIFQFLRSLNMELRENPDYFPLVTWDAGLAPRRLAVYPNYKHHNDRLLEKQDALKLGIDLSEDDEYLKQYHDQRNILIDILHDLGIPSFRFDSWEGDDLIYICSKLTDDGIVMTDDKDLIQLLSPSIKILRPIAHELLNYNEWQSNNNDPYMRKYVITKAIIGDPSDNIPKCADRVGGKTAESFAEIIYNNPNDWKEVIGSVNKKVNQNFVSEVSLNQFSINMELIDLSRVEITDDIRLLIESEIVNSVHVPDYFKVVKKLSLLEITDLDIGRLIATVTSMVSQPDSMFIKSDN